MTKSYTPVVVHYNAKHMQGTENCVMLRGLTIASIENYSE